MSDSVIRLSVRIMKEFKRSILKKFYTVEKKEFLQFPYDRQQTQILGKTFLIGKKLIFAGFTWMEWHFPTYVQ